MINLTKKRNDQSGFALIVVLSGLAILTALFAITSSRSVSQKIIVRADEILIERGQVTRDILLQAIHHGVNTPAEDRAKAFDVTSNGQTYSVRLVDVGGLIDVNTARPELIGALIAYLGLPKSALEKYFAWKEEKNRFLRVSDFLRVVEAGHEHRALLRQIATVHSGRTGVSPGIAPQVVLELIAGRTGTRDELEQAVSDKKTSDSSGVNFNILVETEGRAPWMTGVVHLSPRIEHSRVLSVR